MLLRNLAILAILAIVSLSIIAQHIDYPSQHPKALETAEAGIGSYNITREHQNVDERGIINSVAVEAFDLEGDFLADCEVEWLDDSKTMTCTMLDGHPYRATWFAKRAEFMDLITEDHFSLQIEPLSSLAPDELRPERQTPSGQWVVRGAKNWDEIQRDWAEITPIFGNLMGEIEGTLGIESKYEERERKERQARLKNGTPLKIDLCNGGPTFCDSSDPCEITGVFASTRNQCCTTASGAADNCCLSRTLFTCCANSICQSICPLGLFCECFVDGWLLACQPTCT